MKFKSFKEMLLSNVKSHANNVALAYDEDGEIKSLTYAELYREISARREQIARLDANCVGILQAPSKKWIIDMFACVLARKQTVLLDPMSEPTVIQAQTLATDVETLLTDELTSRHASLLKTAPVGTVAPSKDEGDILFSRRERQIPQKPSCLPHRLCAQARGTDKQSVLATKRTICSACFPSPTCSALCAQCSGLCRRAQNLDHQRHALYRARLQIFQTHDYIRRAFNFEIPRRTQRFERRVAYGFGGSRPRKRANACRRKRKRHRSSLRLRTYRNVERRCDKLRRKSVCDVGMPRRYHNSRGRRRSACQSRRVHDERLLQEPRSDERSAYKRHFAHGRPRKIRRGRQPLYHRAQKDILVLENGNKIFLPEWEKELAVALETDDVALTLENGEITLFVGNKDGFLNVSMLKDKLAAFNKNKPFNLQITGLVVMPDALPKTATGKVKRYAL